MKVLSLMEPWASLIKEKQKFIETRSWNTKYRGELYIHSSLKKINKNDTHIQKLLEFIPDKEMLYGKIICKCKLVDCIYMDDDFLKKMNNNSKEYICGDYREGRYAWILEDIEVLEKPIEAKGQLNIWNYYIDK